MTIEGFKEKLQEFLGSGNYTLLPDMIVKVAEPLFEEIERLKEEKEQLNEQWLKTYHDTEARAIYHEAATATMNVQIERSEIVLSAVRQECEDLRQQRSRMMDELIEKRKYISALEHDVQIISDVSKMRQNEINGLQWHLNEKNKEIERLKTDIADLVFCEECGEEDKRLESNGCYPPRYCHLCKHPELRFERKNP